MKIFYSSALNDTFTGTSSGNDFVSYSTIWSTNNIGVTVDLNLTTSQNTIRAGFDTLSGIDNIIGSNYQDNLVGNANNNFIMGGTGNDVISGNKGDDTLDGGNADDQLYGGDGNDALFGGFGSDKLDGGANDDLLDGGADNDQLLGNTGNDALYGGDGNDVLDGGSGDDFMAGGSGNDAYAVDSANDIVEEGVNLGTDTVYSSINWTLGDNLEMLNLTGSNSINGTGNGLNNAITGNDFANILDGGAGNDALVGGGGNDRLIGGAGTDTLTGGVGADVFAFNSLSEMATGTKRDIITDFSRASVDKIDLHGIFGGTATFLGTGGLTGTGPELNYAVFGKNIIVSGNLNHDILSDFNIQINGLQSISASDFIF